MVAKCLRSFGFVLLLLWSVGVGAFPQMGGSPDAKKPVPGIAMAPSHIVILQADGDLIFGSYYVAVSNTTDAEQDFTGNLRLPRESIDFQAAEGLSNENITILSDGTLSIHKTFPAGLTLLGVQFKVPVRREAKNVLTFTPTQDVPLFFVASPQASLLHFKAEGFVDGIPPMLSGGSYAGIRGQDIKAGQVISIAVDGFPGGRLPFLILGAIMASLLVIGSVILAFKTSNETQLSPRGVYD